MIPRPRTGWPVRTRCAWLAALALTLAAGAPVGAASRSQKVERLYLDDVRPTLGEKPGVELFLRAETRYGEPVEKLLSTDFTIRDNGPGMPTDVMPRVLEPYFTTKPTGTGLGLPAAYCIVRCHDGDLHLQSEEGKGTTVTISLPLCTGDT